MTPPINLGILAAAAGGQIAYRMQALLDEGSGVTTDFDANDSMFVSHYDTIGKKAILAKYNSDGSIFYQKSIGSGTFNTEPHFRFDSQGNAYVFYTSFDSNIGNNDKRVAILVKLDSNGTRVWQRTLFRSGENEYARAIAIDSNDNVIVGFRGQVGTDTNSIVAKYDSSGNIQWQKDFRSGTSSSIPSGMGVDSNNNIYVSMTGFDGNSYTDLFKLNTSGNIQWQRKVSSSVGELRKTSAFGTAVTVDANDDVYLGVTINLDYSALIKFNSSGSKLWDVFTQFDNLDGQARSVAVDNEGNAYWAGKNDFNPPTAYFYKTNSSGTILFQRRFFDSGSNPKSDINSIAIDSNNNISIAGLVQNNPQLDFSALVPGDGSLTTSVSLHGRTISYLTENLSVTSVSISVQSGSISSGSASEYSVSTTTSGVGNSSFTNEIALL